MPDGSSTAHLYIPKLVTVFREGYGFPSLRKDLLAGLTVAIVALPLSMAIAVASGASPERGLYSAIVGGAFVSALSGSRFQIGGPAGAFILLVSSTIAQFGVEGLLLAVFLSGFMLALLGGLRLGSLIRYIPHTVTIGFTCGIAITIFASQIRDLFGLKLSGSEPGPLIPKLIMLGSNLSTLNPWAIFLGLSVAALIFILKAHKPQWPSMLIAVALAAISSALFHLPIETIGSRFGELPHNLPLPSMPSINLSLLKEIFPTAISFTLLGGIESLLSAKVADNMTGRKHRSNMELIAQGVANIGASLFGGISVTGTIARTATNIRAGATSPLSGIFHSAFLLLFLILAAPLAAFIPLSALAGILLVVCWDMAEKGEFLKLLRDRPSAIILLTTFGITLLIDLTTGIIAGCIVAAFIALFSFCAKRNRT